MLKKHLLAFVVLAFVIRCPAQQQPAIIDSIYKTYLAEKDLSKKAIQAGKLSLMYLTIDLNKADSFGRKSIEHAELSRDRKTMVRAYAYNGDRYLQLGSIKENIPKSIDFFQRAYNLARESKLTEQMVGSLLRLASVERTVPNADKSMNYTTQAFSLISDAKPDSLLAACYISFGDSYNLKKEKLLALKNFFNAARIAEITGNKSLQRTCYQKLSEFYFLMENYDKALDYAMKATNKLDEMDQSTAAQLKVVDLNYIGLVFMQKKDYDLAIATYNQAIEIADSLKIEPLKIAPYLSIFNTYLLSNQPEKARSFFNNSSDLKNYIIRTGFSSVLDHAYGYIYTELGMMDSARYHYQKALPFFENQLNNANKINFLDHLSRFYLKANEYPKAIEVLNKANATAIQMEDLDWQQKISRNLDSAYQLSGDYKMALHYSNLSQKLKDTLTLLGKDEDILQLQISDEQERQARINAEAEEKKKRRDQFQYLAITIGIASAFILLVMMGMFRVSARTIKIIGFFTFLMFFEFLFLIFKKNIYSITGGEPWKDLALMIGLAAILLPFHHWLEHRVIHYLTNKQLLKIDKSRYTIKNIFRRSNSPVHLES